MTPVEMLVVLGAGGHAKVVLDAWLAGGYDERVVEVRDDDPVCSGRRIGNFFVQFPAVSRSASGTMAVHDVMFHAAVGNSSQRRELWRRAVASGWRPKTVIHPRAVISPTARIGEGCFVGAQAVIGPSAAIGRGTIVNHGALVDHDCTVGEFSHIGVFSSMSGGAVVGDDCVLSAGARLLVGRAVPSGEIIPAGVIL